MILINIIIFHGDFYGLTKEQMVMGQWGFTTASMTLIYRCLRLKAETWKQNLVKHEATKKCYLTIYI